MNDPRPDARPDTGTEAGLVAAAAAGSGEAFGRLMAPYRRPLFGYLVRFVGRRDLAEDLLQETLIRCWRGLPKYRDRDRFGAWLFTIARHAVYDAGRSRARRRALFAADSIDEHPEPRTEPDAPDALRAEQLLFRVTAILQDLPAERREVFLLRLHGDLTFREIAAQQDRPLGTVLSDMHRAVREIRRGMKNDAE